MQPANRKDEEAEARYGQDLHPHDRFGQTAGPERYATITADAIKELRELVPQVPNDVLAQIPVIAPGGRLEEGATYFDLAHPDRGEFTGMNDTTATHLNYYVGKADVDWDVWNLITGITDPARLGRFAKPQTRAA